MMTDDRHGIPNLSDSLPQMGSRPVILIIDQQMNTEVLSEQQKEHQDNNNQNKL